MKTIRVVLADDHAAFRRVVREFLSNIPNVELVAEACNGKEAVEQVDRHGPDVVLMDISMPVQNGLEATRIIKERWPKTRVLIATLHDDRMYRLQAKKVKADGYILKSNLKPLLEAEFSQGPTQSNPKLY